MEFEGGQEIVLEYVLGDRVRSPRSTDDFGCTMDFEGAKIAGGKMSLRRCTYKPRRDVSARRKDDVFQLASRSGRRKRRCASIQSGIATTIIGAMLGCDGGV